MGNINLDHLPEGVRIGNENLVRLTQNAGKKIESLTQQKGHPPYLRIRIAGGGCNGLSYKFNFIDAFKRGDILIQSQGALIVVDSKSALYLKGTELDYSHKMIGGGFKFKNPNAQSSCSCGESFSV